MPALISEPLILQLPADLPARFPHAINLARQLALKYVHHYVVTEADLQTVGGVLWQTLDADAALESARLAAGTRILPLVVESVDSLAQSLPWECLYHPQHGFLGQQRGFTLSRRLTADVAPPAALSTGPLKVLCSPPCRTIWTRSKERLDVESEQAAVLEALDPLIQGGLVELTTPDDGRFACLKSLSLRVDGAPAKRLEVPGGTVLPGSGQSPSKRWTDIVTSTGEGVSLAVARYDPIECLSFSDRGRVSEYRRPGFEDRAVGAVHSDGRLVLKTHQFFSPAGFPPDKLTLSQQPQN